jgi:hypothetical protein
MSAVVHQRVKCSLNLHFLFFDFLAKVVKNVRREASIKNPLTGDCLEIDVWFPSLNLGFEYQVSFFFFSFPYLFFFLLILFLFLSFFKKIFFLFYYVSTRMSTITSLHGIPINHLPLCKKQIVSMRTNPIFI